MVILQICNDFSKTPGGRLVEEGPYSGEKFRNELLIPMYEKAEKNGEKLEVIFDGCYGFAACFLEEAFGGLVRYLGKAGVLDKLVLVSNEDETIPKTVEQCVKEAEEML